MLASDPLSGSDFWLAIITIAGSVIGVGIGVIWKAGRTSAKIEVGLEASAKATEDLSETISGLTVEVHNLRDDHQNTRERLAAVEARHARDP